MSLSNLAGASIDPNANGVKGLQWGDADPAFTLRTYAHALREEEIDLSFADFDGVGRPKTAQWEENENREASNTAERLARREGFEPPTLRFEGTAG